MLALGLLIRGGAGALLGFFYSLVADGLPGGFKGRSPGKRLMRIRVVDENGNPARLKTSIIRNIPVGIVTFLMVIPFWGWILAVLVGIPFGLIELSLIARAKGHQRLGDVLAGSLVIRESSS